MRRLEILVYVGLAAAAVAWWAARTDGGLTYNDSYQYLSIAGNLRRSGSAATSIVHFDVERASGRIPAPATTFPPGYPALIAALSWPGVPLDWAGVVISMASFLAVLLLLRAGGRALALGPGVQRITMVAWALNAHASEYGATVLSESLFTALAIAAVVLLLAPEREGAGRRAILAAFLIGMAYWTRHAGLFFAIAFNGYALYRAARNHSRAAAWCLALGVCDTIVALGMARNVALSGSWRGGNTRLTWHPLAGRLRDLAVTQVSLLLGGISARPEFLCCAALALVAGIAIAARWWRAVMRLRHAPAGFPSAGFLLLWIGTYVAGTTFAALTTDISFSARLFVPILPPVLLLAGWVATGLGDVAREDAGAARRALPAAVFLAGYLGANVTCFALDDRVPPHVEVARRLSFPSADGRSLTQWIEANVPPEAVLVSTYGQATAHALRRSTVSLVSSEYSTMRWEEEATRLTMARYGAHYLIVFTDSVRPGGSLDSAFLLRLAAAHPPGWLELAARNGQALVYRTIQPAGLGGAGARSRGETGVPDTGANGTREVR